MDVAFAAMRAWDARSEAASAAGTHAGTGMLAPEQANGVLAQHFVLGVFRRLFIDFGSLVNKLLFLGRTLLLRLQG